MRLSTPSLIQDMNLSNKALLFISFLVIAFLVILWQFQTGQSLLDDATKKAQQIRAIGERLQHIELNVLEARKAEKEFLMKGDPESVKSHESIMTLTNSHIKELETAFTEQEELASLSKLKESLEIYNHNFDLVVQQTNEVGFDETSGLLAKMKRTVKKVERVIKGSNVQSLLSRILIIRRSEMDFVVRKDEKYMRRYERDFEMFREELKSAETSDRYIRRITEGMDKYQKVFLDVYSATLKIKTLSDEFNLAANSISPVLKNLNQKGDSLLKNNQLVMENARNNVELRFMLILLVVAVVACGVLWFSARSLIKGIKSAASVGTRVAEGDLDTTIEITSKDEIGSLLQTLSRMQQQLKARIERDQKIANEAQRIKTALDGASTSMMVVNNDYRIIYLNQSAEQLFLNAEEDIQGEISDFSAAELLGSSIDQFHKDPTHQRNILDQLTGTHRARIELAGHVLDLTLNMVINDVGERLGVAMEWEEVTEQVNAEVEIDKVVASVSEGDLEQRISLDGKQGFFLSLGSSINELTGTVDNSLSQVEEVLAGLAEGELLRRVPEGKQGAFERLGNNVNQTSERLLETVTSIREIAVAITTSSEEIASGNDNLSRSTETQAANLEETASTMEEFTSTVRNNADSAQEANTLASDARSLAEQGGNEVEQAVEAMVQITDAADKIQDIIGVIDEIAFQTNLLALNASVEAARAGEQGRGFAVVATEVRNLAQRSAAAAKEIKTLISDSGEKVQIGTKRVNQSGETLQSIVGSVRKVGGIIAEIAAASREQSIGIEQVNKAVAEMDGAVQQNAALAEQASAASQAMNGQAQELDKMVAFFNTK